MRQIVEAMVTDPRSDPEVARFLDINKVPGEVALEILLSWITAMHFVRQHEPMKLNPTAKFDAILIQLIAQVPGLQEIFRTDDNLLDYQPTVSLTERKEIQSFVEFHYRAHYEIVV